MNSRSSYYKEMEALAIAKRSEFNVETSKLNLTVMRRIYKQEGIKIDNWKFGQKIKAVYFCDNDDYSVAVNKTLPRAPKLFSLVHELKHHFVDQEKIKNGQIKCGDWNVNQVIEIAAEIFAAEFIFPQSEMLELIGQLEFDSGDFSPERVVEFKRKCPAIVSYTFLVKRFERFGFCELGEFKSVKFQNLEEEIYGRPFYKEEWFKKRRAAKKKK